MPRFLASISNLWVILAVDDTVLATTASTRNIGLDGQLLSPFHHRYSGRFGWGLLAVSVGVYWPSLKFKPINSTLNNFVDSLLSFGKITADIQSKSLEGALKLPL